MTDRIKWSDPVTGLDGVIAVAQALKDGKNVQYLDDGKWESKGEVEALFLESTYRIGEEVKPRECFVNVYVGGEQWFHKTREAADKVSRAGRLECIHVREVIE